MNYTEIALTFPCAGETLLGIVTLPESPADTGVVIPVGGPQYRAGSHRQFTLLARQLAEAGYPALRFDYRGMGDSTGAQIDFESATPDIAAALDALAGRCPELQRFVLWGLCDAASAALLYWQQTQDPRIARLCLLNPWVRSEATLARTQVRHYYGQRLMQKEFWRKLLSGRLNLWKSIAELLGKLGKAATASSSTKTANESFQDRMAIALRTFPGSVQLILSANDYTAKEFLEHASISAAWNGILDRPSLARIDVDDADHTFSSAEWRATVAEITIGGLKNLGDHAP